MMEREEDIAVTVPDQAGPLIHTLMANLFPQKEAAFRELVQNAMGAEARSVWFWTGASEYGEGPNDISCLDDGAGMDGQDARNDLLTISKGQNPLGRFGLGFLSCFALSEKATIYSCKATMADEAIAGIALQLVRQSDHSGARPSTTISGKITHDVTRDSLVAIGLIERSGATPPHGTKIVLRNPVLVAGNNLETLAHKPDKVQQVLEHWCRHIDPSRCRIFLNGTSLNVGLVLSKALQHQFAQPVDIPQPGARATRETEVRGCVAFSSSQSISLFQHGIFVSQLASYGSPAFVQSFLANVGSVQALVDCAAFTLNIARDHVEPDLVLSKALDVTGEMVASGLVPLLVSKITANERLTDDELAYAKSRIFAAIKNGEVLEGDATLEALAAVPVFSTVVNERISLARIVAEARERHRIYYASRRDSTAEELVSRHYAVLERSQLPDVQAFVNFCKRYNCEVIDVATVAESVEYRLLDESELTERQRAFLTQCRRIDSAVRLGEVRDWKGDLLPSRVAHYNPASGVIFLNIKAERLQRAIATGGSFSWLLALPIIAHERAHEKVTGHSDVFLASLESVLEEKFDVLTDLLADTKPPG